MHNRSDGLRSVAVGGVMQVVGESRGRLHGDPIIWQMNSLSELSAATRNVLRVAELEDEVERRPKASSRPTTNRLKH